MRRDRVEAGRSAIGRWLASVEGGVSVLIASTMSLLALASLLAVDVARINLVQGRLQAAVDAAVLGASRDLGSSEVAADARKLFEANMPVGYLGTTEQRFDVSTSSDSSGLQALAMTVKLSMPSAVLAFGRGLNVGRKALEAHATAERRVRSTELVMVLDNTGSLAGQPIKDLRTAATDLTSALFGLQDSVPGLYVGVVPYVASVNIGLQHVGWIENLATRAAPPTAWTDYRPGTWKGCVMAQPSPQDSEEGSSAIGRLIPYFWASSSDNSWPKNGTISQIPQTNAAYGPNLGCGPAITPLTASRSVINQAIKELDAWNRGGTIANLGLVWGWRVLSPQWRGLWHNKDGSPISSAHPIDYDSSYNSKVLVLMTDGQNGWYQDDLMAYGRPNSNTMGTTKAQATNDINARMDAACSALKRQGIVLFTVTFGSVDPATKARYTKCASKAEQNDLFPGQKYFHAPNGNDLMQAFSNIAGQLSELKLVK